MRSTIAPDSTLSFVRDGYTFGERRFRAFDDDAFRTRLLGRPVVVLRGRDAARFFYEGGRFHRTDAMPRSVFHLLQDVGSVQTLEGDAHRRRKELFLGLLTGGSEAALVDVFRAELAAAAATAGAGDVRLIDLFSQVLTRAACRWAGMPVPVAAELERTDVLRRMVDAAGTVGPQNWAARAARTRAERLLADAVRSERRQACAPGGSALAVIARYSEPEQLSERVAAVELLNLLRPVVAVARFMVFAALALHRRPEWRESFAEGDDSGVRWFSNETRRFYPFFPVIGGRASEAVEWRDHRFEKNAWAVLDLYATNHDPATWDEPHRFLPQRFDGLTVDPNTLIPQGGGTYENDHRCPGEPVTLELMDETVRQLTRTMRFTVPGQDLRVSLRRFPALPESGLIVRGLTGRASGDDD